MKLRSGHWGADYSANTVLNDAEWVHAVYTYDATADDAQIFLNGVKDGENLNQRSPNGSGNMIFGARNNGGNPFNGDMDELAVWGEVLSAADVVDLYNGASPVGAASEDSDSDGLLDGLELRLLGDLAKLDGSIADPMGNTGDGSGDYDGDGVTDLEEVATLGTNPILSDTDGDGLDDGVESGGGTWVSATETGTDPLDPDSDKDGLLDGVETNTDVNNSPTDTGTDPNIADSDGDGFNDGLEIAEGSDPNDPNSLAGIPEPLVYFSFEGDTLDQTTNGNDGTAAGNGNVVVATGGVGALGGSTPDGVGQFSVGGTTGYLQVPGIQPATDLRDSPNPNEGSYTLSAWLKPETLADGFIFGQMVQGIHNGVRGGGRLSTAHWASDFSATTVLTANTWTHATWVYNGITDTAKIYLNGKLDGEFTQNPPNGSGDLIIGARNGSNATNAGDAHYVGELDDVAVWNIAMPELIIEELAKGASPIEATDEDSDNDGIFDGSERVATATVALPAGNLTDLIEIGKTGVGSGAGSGDFDGDGISDIDEICVTGTNPIEADTDMDGLNDFAELNPTAPRPVTDPLDPDSDDDGLLDGLENNTGLLTYDENDPDGFTGTDPLIVDTDGDNYSDGDEITLGSDPTDINSFPVGGALPFEDDFDDNTFDTVFWNVLDNIPPRFGASVTEQNGQLEFVGRGSVVSRLQYDPDVTGLAICGEWTFGSGADFIQILTQSDGVIDPANCCGETQSGVEFFVNGTDGNIVIRGRGGVTVNQTRADSLGPVGAGSKFAFQVIDNASASRAADLEFIVTEIRTDGQPLRIGYAQASVTADTVNMNHIVIHNRENPVGGTYTAIVDNLSILEISNSDVDSMPDWYEVKYSLDENADDAVGQLDGDGVSNGDEYTNYTNPASEDTEQDGLNDNVETNTGTWVSATETGTNPLKADSDGDGLRDSAETNTGIYEDATNTGTNPNTLDYDGDGIPDGAENGSGIFVDAGNPGTSPVSNDSDGDGYTDNQEIAALSDPNLPGSVPAIEPPLVYFDFEEIDPVNATLVTDKTVNMHDGAINGDVTLDGVAGAPAGSSPTTGGRFSTGSEGFLNVPTVDMNGLIHNVPNVGEGSYTLACWLKPTTLADGFIFGQTTQGVHNGVRGGGKLNTAHWGSDFTATTTLTAGDWVHAVWTYDGFLDAAKIYLNGAEDGSFTQTAPTGGGNLLIGKRQDGDPFVGDLDDVTIWSQVLDTNIIESLALGAAIPASVAPEVDFEITYIEANPNTPQVFLIFDSVSLQTYAIERSNDLLNWTVIDPAFVGEEGEVESGVIDDFSDLGIVDRPPINKSPFFYRVRVAE